MNPRTQQILEAVIREFINTGEPVSSKVLYKKYDFEVKPATIRNELNFLDEEDFLSQPHTSSGRVPTDKAYRFLAHKVLADFAEDLLSGFDREINALISEFARGDFRDFVHDVSEHLGVLSAGYNSEEKSVYKSGLDDLFERLVSDIWFTDRREIYAIAKDFENLDERMVDLLNFLKKENEPKIFIGKSPITRSHHLSVIAERFNADGEDFVVAAIGPKRMDYEDGIKFFLKLRKKINS